jgi:hypothetical protein
MSFLPSKPAATHDIYAPVHKGLRMALSRLLIRLGAVDALERGAVATLMADLRAQMILSAAHLDHEEREIHAALEARAPGAAADLYADHDRHRASFTLIEMAIVAVEAATPDRRRAPLHRLYLAFTRFLADDLAHMAEEEEVILPVLQDLFTDGELMAIEGRIGACLTPDRMIAYAQLMIPASSPAERLALLTRAREGMIRDGSQPEAFAGLLNFGAKPSLPRDQWEALVRDLDLAA